MSAPSEPATGEMNGKLFACIEPECPSAEWVIEPKTALAEEKKHCPRDGKPLSWVPLDPIWGREPIVLREESRCRKVIED